MRYEIPNRNQTPCNNTDKRTSPDAFYEPTQNREIDIREMGGIGAFNDLMEQLGNMEELKREEGMGGSITESKSLILGHRIESN